MNEDPQSQYIDSPTVNDQILDYILARYEGSEDAVETEEGIQVLGTMPNTEEFGWFYAGTRAEIEQDIRLGR